MKLHSASPRIVITGLGAVTPLGCSVPLLWEALLRGDDAIAPLDRFPLGGIACERGGQIRGYTPPATPAAPPRWDLASGFAAGACAEAIAQAGGGVSQLGLVTASNFGALDEAERGLAGEAPGCLPACAHALVTARLAAAFELPGPAVTLSLSCAASAAALAYAADLLCAGRAQRLLVVGYDVLSRCAWSGLCALRTMTRDCVRPFDLRRSGTIFSEGAAALLLERADLCALRGGEPLAELSGWATGNNGFHMTAPPPRAAGSAQAMRQALARAGLPPAAIDHINAHGTGTQPNDVTEAQAIADLFGARAGSIPLTANKSSLGHMLGAAGGIEAIVAVLSLRHGCIPPTTHFTTPDPACPVDLVTGAPRRTELRHVLSNSAGFGGCNAAVVLSRAARSAGDGACCRPRGANSDSVVITGLGVLSALGIGRPECAAAWGEGETALLPAARASPPAGIASLAGEVPAFQLESLLPTPKTYLDRHAELLLAACALALQDGGLAAGSYERARAGLAMGSAWGALGTLARFFTDYLQKGPRLVKPMLFPHAYANAAISLASMEWELRGPHLNFVSGRDASTQALVAALDALRAGAADIMLAGGVEALAGMLWAALAEAGRPAAPGEGAAVLLLERAAAAHARGARVLARLAGGGLAGGPPAELASHCAAAMRRALADAGLEARDIRRVIHSACGLKDLDDAEGRALREVLGADLRPLAPAALYGNLEGASGALQMAGALFASSSATLPALVLTSDPAGSAAALVVTV
jgi:3-oxoacyl-[acyl-carrier-protein] synthase II